MQEFGAILVLATALGYLGWRTLKRRGSNCCGEKECPAAKEMVERMLARPIHEHTDATSEISRGQGSRARKDGITASSRSSDGVQFVEIEEQRGS